MSIDVKDDPKWLADKLSQIAGSVSDPYFRTIYLKAAAHLRAEPQLHIINISQDEMVHELREANKTLLWIENHIRNGVSK